MVKELFSWPDSPQRLLEDLELYERGRKRHPRLQLLIFGRSATRAEIVAVLRAADRHGAARILFAERINWFQ